MPAPRLASPERRQIRLVPTCIDDAVADDHPVRAIWNYVDRLELSEFYADIRAVVGAPGRPPIDPKLLLALWLFATTEAIGSARQLSRLCERDLPYMWLCGGVSVNYHTLADFRSSNEDRFEKLLVAHVTSLTSAGVVQLTRVAQDGVRVRAHAGSSSFRRRAKLEEFEKAALEQVQLLKKELHQDPEAGERRKLMAKKRAVEEREERVQEALKRAKALEEKRNAAGSHKSKAEQEKSRRKVAKGDVRASITDPDAHRMKMADGGHRPAYNEQVAIDPVSKFIVGVTTTNDGLDGGLLPPMIEKINEKYGKTPEHVAADGGFVTLKAIDALHAMGVAVYAPVDKPRNDRNPFLPMKGDSPGVAAWRQRMGTDAGKGFYGLRSAVEWVFARMRNWGLRQFATRGKRRVQSTFLLYALTHNFALDLARLQTAEPQLNPA